MDLQWYAGIWVRFVRECGVQAAGRLTSTPGIRKDVL